MNAYRAAWLPVVCALICGACNQAVTKSGATQSRPAPVASVSSAVTSVNSVEPSPTPQSKSRVAAQPDEYGQQRIRFGRGRNTATVKGFVAVGEGVSYVVSAREGQTMTATITSRKKDDDRHNDPLFRIFSPEEDGLKILNDDGSHWSGTLTYAGDYSIDVDAGKESAEYVLTVKIQ
ncbi:MAG: hypothetical protein H0W76_16045 [Pyrinomonadaceae bacterium]|nr:hypothetical protein [Pyrinomonadaceae bacterium]